MTNIFKVLVPCSPMRYSMAKMIIKGIVKVLSVGVPEERIAERVYINLSAAYRKTRRLSAGTLFRKARY